MTKRRQILEGLTYALQGLNSRIRASLLTEIVDYLPQDLNEEVLQKAFIATKSIRDEGVRLNVLKSLAHKLPPDLLPEAIAIDKVIKSSRLAYAQALKVLTPLLPSDLLLEALDVARDPNLNSEYTIALALSVLADELPEELQTEVALEALTAAESIPSGDYSDVYRSAALTAVADVVPEALQAEVLQKALDSARGVEDECCRSISLANLVSKLPEVLQAEVLLEALDSAKGVEDECCHSISLAANLVSKLPEVLQSEVLQKALDAVRDNRVDWSAIALLILIPKLPLGLLPEALTIARDIQQESDRAMALIAITARLPEVLPETFALVKSIKYKSRGIVRKQGYFEAMTAIVPNLLLSELLPGSGDKRKVPIAMAPHLSSELLPEAFDIAKDIPLRWDRIPVLIALASRMSKMPNDELLPLWQTTKHWLSQQSGQELAHHVLALSAVIHAIGGQEAMVEALIEIQNAERWQQ